MHILIQNLHANPNNKCESQSHSKQNQDQEKEPRKLSNYLQEQES